MGRPEAAAAACCCARSLRDAFPRFLRSRIYSHARPNSYNMSVGPTDTTSQAAHTNTMRARIPAIAFCPQLITLITSPANPPTDGPRCPTFSILLVVQLQVLMTAMRRIIAPIVVRMVTASYRAPQSRCRVAPWHGALLQLLEGILRTLRQSI